MRILVLPITIATLYVVASCSFSSNIESSTTRSVGKNDHMINHCNDDATWRYHIKNDGRVHYILNYQDKQPFVILIQDGQPTTLLLPDHVSHTFMGENAQEQTLAVVREFNDLSAICLKAILQTTNVF